MIINDSIKRCDNHYSYVLGPGEELDLFSLVRGRYEAERISKQYLWKRTVPDYAFNVLNYLGLLYRPVVDEDYLRSGGSKPSWPNGQSFAVCLTHDVDHVSQYNIKEYYRRELGFSENASSTVNKIKKIAGLGWDIVRISMHKMKQDPLHCLERWLEVENKIGTNSTFFFWPGWKAVRRHHYSDCLYDMEDRIIFDGQRCIVAEMIREIDHRGWEIGLHSSWYSFADADEMKRQKEVLEKTLGRDVVSVRQHFLHYDIRITPLVHAAAGFRYDSTLGFNDNVGFRLGTCYIRRLFNLEANIELNIFEVPLIIQDGAMLNPMKGMRLDEETAFQYVKQIAESVKRVGGILTLLWHPCSILKPQWWMLYQRSIEYLNNQSAYLGSLRRIGEIWENNNLRCSND